MSADLEERLREARAIFETDGVARIPNVFDRSEINLMRASAMMALSDPEGIRRAGYKHTPFEVKHAQEEKFPALLFWPALTSRYLNRVRTDMRMARIVSEFLGPNVKQLNNQVYFRLPGDPDSFSWHQDIVFRTPREDYPGVESHYLQTIVVMDEMRPDGGAIWFVPGSHKLGDLNLVQEDTSDLRDFDPARRRGAFSPLEPRIYTAMPGDVLLWHVLTVHGSAPNNSTNMRMTYMNGFARASGARQWPYYLKNGHIQPIKAELIP